MRSEKAVLFLFVVTTSMSSLHVSFGVHVSQTASDETCRGLYVGTTPGRRDIVRDGVTAGAFTAQSPPLPVNTLSSEYYSSPFHFHKVGKPVRGTVELVHTNPHGLPSMRPAMSGSLVRDRRVRETEPVEIEISGDDTDLIVSYNCLDAGGTSILWLHVHVDAEEAREACGTNRAEAVDVYIVWRKVCRSELTRRTGIAIGTSPKASDVVSNGAVTRAWTNDYSGRDDRFGEVVPSYASSSVFYLRTTDGSRQVFGSPRFETDETRVIVMLKTVHDGGVASAEPTRIDVEYLCDRAASASLDVTMIVDLCARDVSSDRCDGAQNFGYEPIVTHWKKNCGVAHDGESFWLSDLLILCTLGGMMLWIFGCCYNYSVKRARGIDVVPGGPYFLKALDALQRRRNGSHRYTATATSVSDLHEEESYEPGRIRYDEYSGGGGNESVHLDASFQHTDEEDGGDGGLSDSEI